MNLYTRKYAAAQRKKLPNSTINLIKTYLPISSKDFILEIGIGYADSFRFLLSQTPNVHGIDINQWLIKKINKPTIIWANATNMPYPDHFFNKSLSIHTLEHIKDLRLVFKELNRITKTDGLSLHIFPAHFLTKAEGAIGDTFKMYPFNPLKAWREAHKLHIHNLNPKKIEDLLKGLEFKLVFSKKVFVPECGGTNWLVLLKK